MSELPPISKLRTVGEHVELDLGQAAALLEPCSNPPAWKPNARVVVSNIHRTRSTASSVPLKDPDQAQRRDRGVDLDMQCLAVPRRLIDNRSTVAESRALVAAKVRMPKQNLIQ